MREEDKETEEERNIKRDRMREEDKETEEEEGRHPKAKRQRKIERGTERVKGKEEV